MKPESGVLADASNEVRVDLGADLPAAAAFFFPPGTLRTALCEQVAGGGRASQSQLNFRAQKGSSGSRKGALHFSAAAAAQQSLGKPFKPVKPSLPKIPEQPPPAPKTRGQQHEPARAPAGSGAGAGSSIKATGTAEQELTRQPSKAGKDR